MSKEFVLKALKPFSLLFLAGMLHAQHHHHHAPNVGPKKNLAVTKRSNQPKEKDFYKLVNIGLPSDLILEGGGICAIPNGRIAVSTRRGEIWIVENPYSLDYDNRPSFRRFARGLHEILGLRYHEGSFYVAQRGELTKLTDTDGDGEADRYDCVSSLPTVGHYHEYSYGPVFDSEGNMVVSLNVAFGSVDWYNAKSYAPWRGWVIKVKPDGEIIPWAAGVRSPCGIGIGPEGKVFYTENQGDWVGSGYFTVLEKGDFMANPASLNWADSPGSTVLARKEMIQDFRKPMFEVKKDIPSLRLPSVWLPHGVLGVSTSDFVMDSMGGRFGPFEGQFLIGDQGQSKISRVYLEKVNGVYQGCAFGFREGFASGVLRQCWGNDGSMFVAQTNRGWASTGPAPFALQRLIWAGKTPFEMKTVQARTDGFEIQFTLPVDSASVFDSETWNVSSFTYNYHQKYGSPVVREGKCPLKAIRLSADKMSVRLVLDSMRQFFIHEIKAPGLLSADGYELLHSSAYYTLNEIPTGQKADINSPDWKKPKQKVVINPQKKNKDLSTSPKSGALNNGIQSFTVKKTMKQLNQMPASWITGPDKTIQLGTTPGMRFDKAEIEAKPGQKIRFVFNNYDDMQHNFVLGKPKSADKIGEAAGKLGIHGNKMDYVPDMGLVLYNTGIVEPGNSETIWFEVPPFEGNYDFVCTMPGHYMVMRGVLRVKK